MSQKDDKEDFCGREILNDWIEPNIARMMILRFLKKLSSGARDFLTGTFVHHIQPQKGDEKHFCGRTGFEIQAAQHFIKWIERNF